YYENTLQTELFEDKRNAQLKTFDPFNNVTSASFFDSDFIFGISDGFDIVIGNPPYLQEGRVPKHHFNDISYYQGKMDIWYSFACLGIDYLKEGGILAFIAKNNWLTNFGASIMRNRVIKETKINQIIDFNNLMVFDSADIQTMIMMFIKEKSEEEYTFDYRKIKDANNISRDKTFYIETILDNSNSDNILYLEPLINRKKLESTTLSFSEFDSILDKIDNDARYLE